jgi:hypothetical protein
MLRLRAYKYELMPTGGQGLVEHESARPGEATHISLLIDADSQSRGLKQVHTLITALVGIPFL